MTDFNELLRQGRHEELWQRCCGFIDLSLENFMKIQQRLLLEQIELLKKCELGHYILNGTNPCTVAEFRQQVPLTTYADYAPYLQKRRKKVLPERPLVWLHTSGRSFEHPSKWIPITGRLYEELGAVILGVFIFGSCKQRGEITLREGDKYLYTLAPAPYLSGVMGRRMDDESILDFLPPLDEAEKTEFSDRIQQGFKLALVEGLDICAGISSVLLAVGERFSQRSGNIDIRPFLRNPRALTRILRGLARSKLARRPLLPKDVWSLKGVVTGGIDSTVFKNKIKEIWGVYPLDIYGCTEATIIATQTWDYQGMTFIPNLNFFEFIPEKDSLKLREDPSYQPETLLLDEVTAGENYELVITNFLGGTLVRYRIGDMVKITSLRNTQVNIDIPQMVFYSRVDDLIDIAGLTRLTERIIWQAIERSGVAYRDWTARKEVMEEPRLHLYLELKQDGHRPKEDITGVIHQQLKEMDNNYARLTSITGSRPLEVTLLPANAFQDYILRQQASGTELAHFRMPHINPPDSMLDFLINGSHRISVTSREERRRASVYSR
jgi:hypothetical protein